MEVCIEYAHPPLDVHPYAHPYAHNPYAHPYAHPCAHPCAHPYRMKFGGMHTPPFTHKHIVGKNQVIMIGVQKTGKNIKKTMIILLLCWDQTKTTGWKKELL